MHLICRRLSCDRTHWRAGSRRFSRNRTLLALTRCTLKLGAKSKPASLRLAWRVVTQRTRREDVRVLSQAMHSGSIHHVSFNMLQQKILLYCFCLPEQPYRRLGS